MNNHYDFIGNYVRYELKDGTTGTAYVSNVEPSYDSDTGLEEIDILPSKNDAFGCVLFGINVVKMEKIDESEHDPSKFVYRPSLEEIFNSTPDDWV